MLKLRPDCEEERGIFICGGRNCDICNILEPGNEFKSTITGKVYKINFHFHWALSLYSNNLPIEIHMGTQLLQLKGGDIFRLINSMCRLVY